MSAHIDDQDYVERKRLQVERFFEKMIGRTELIEHADFIHFLSSDMVNIYVWFYPLITLMMLV